jgi:hypothetical protein
MRSRTQTSRDDAPDPYFHVRSRDLWLWFAVLAPPTGFMLDLVASFVLVVPACRLGTMLPLRIATAVCAALILAGGIVGFFLRRGSTRRPSSEEATRVERERVMAWSALVLSAFFLMSIAALAIPELGTEPCK